MSERLSYKQDRARRQCELRKLQLDLERIREITQGDKLATWIRGGPIFGNVYSEVLLDCILKEASEIQQFRQRHEPC
jgi:hypothetical protein